jgi:acid phosphatase (class A)
MKRIAIGMMVIASITGFAQKKNQQPLTPARGHYQQLGAFSPAPDSKNAELDQLKFPFDAAAAERRLSIKPYYLTNTKPEDLNLPNPPANSSEQTRAELNYLLGLQAQRTKLDTDASLIMADIYYNIRVKPEDSTYAQYRQNLFHIGRSMGTWFNPENLPVTADFMAHVWQDASYFIWAFKYKYLRVRPYVLDTTIQNLEETNWAAYPSGHAANSYVNAFVYQELAPQFADLLIKDAYDMAHSREILGVHYPSDSETSRILARQLVNKLFENEQFRKDFAVVQKEWKEKAKESFTKPTSSTQGKKISCAKTCD